MENNEARDCKSCANAHVLYERIRDGDPHTTNIAPSGYALCRRPTYKNGRAYVVRDARRSCAYYAPRTRGE